MSDVFQSLGSPKGPDAALQLHCGGIPLGRAHVGQRCNNIAVRLVTDVSKGLVQ